MVTGENRSASVHKLCYTELSVITVSSYLFCFVMFTGMNQTVLCTLTPPSLMPVHITHMPNWCQRQSEIRKLYRREKVHCHISINRCFLTLEVPMYIICIITETCNCCSSKNEAVQVKIVNLLLLIVYFIFFL